MLRTPALTLFNDRSALGLIDHLRRAGTRVPEDLSVVGFDDIRASSYAHVCLTTVRQDGAEIARRLVRAAIGDARLPRPPQLVTSSLLGLWCARQRDHQQPFGLRKSRLSCPRPHASGKPMMTAWSSRNSLRRLPRESSCGPPYPQFRP
jgi:hypothetical protein